MKKMAKGFIWTLVFLGIWLALDQAMLRMEKTQGLFGQVQGFYLDFRARLFSLPGDKPVVKSLDKPVTKEIEVLIEQVVSEAPAKEVKEALRYIYADESGQIIFADSLEEIPEALRKGARAMQLDP